MQLLKFEPGSGGYTPGLHVRISQGGYVTISREGQAVIGLKDSDRVSVAKDIDTGIIYISIQKSGYKPTRIGKTTKSVKFTCSHLKAHAGKYKIGMSPTIGSESNGGGEGSWYKLEVFK